MHTFIAVLTATLAAIAGGLAGASSAQASETDSTYAVAGCRWLQPVGRRVERHVQPGS